uniref:DUF4283 domain-containing protein n=1 Tax=Cannabis sativa TaxID=3483 RepID=A0A803QBU9_CANSA
MYQQYEKDFSNHKNRIKNEQQHENTSPASPTTKKKRVGQKPATATTADIEVDLPSIHEAEAKPELIEEFHDTIENLIMENRIELVDAEVPSPSTKLTYTEPVRVGYQIVAKLDLEEIEVEASYWKNAIVCFVLGAKPPFKVFGGFVKRIRGNLGIEKVVRMHSGYLDSMRMTNFVPVWIRLNGLGLQYWGKNNLSALVSTIGKPIMIDKVTQERSMVKFARILVEIEISDAPPKTISFINERKQLVEQTIEYERLPSKCSACANLGHTVANCNKEKKVEKLAAGKETRRL